MTKLNAIDLGLSVLWADKNIYADEPMEIGMEMSINSAFFKLIDDDEFDGDWRLPTLEEILELMSSEKTEWTPVTENGKQTGWKVKGITGDNAGCIKLPLVHHENGELTLYWTGDRMDEEDHYCLAMDTEDVFHLPTMSAEPNCVRLVRNRDIELTEDENERYLQTYLQNFDNHETRLTEKEEYVLEHYNPLKSKDTSEIESALGIDHNYVQYLWMKGSTKMSKDIYRKLVLKKKVQKY